MSKTNSKSDSKPTPSKKQSTPSGKQKAAQPTAPTKVNIPKFDLIIDQKKRDDGKIILTITIPAKLTPDLITGAAFILALQNKINLEKVEVEKFAETVIEQVGEAQYNAFINHYAMTAMAPYAITEKGIAPIMEPEVNSNAEIAPNKDFTFVAVVTPKPHYELESYDPVTVKLPKIAVSEAEIDQQIYNLAQRATQTMADEGAIIWEGKEVVFGIETHFADSGEEVPHMTADKRVYQLGDGFLPEEFDKELLGLKAGEFKTFEFDLPGAEGPDGEPGLARTVSTTINIIQINKKVIPDINDTWVITNMPEAKNVAGLRELLREEGNRYKTNEAEGAKFFMAASTLAERFIGFIPDEIYEFTRSDMMANLQQTLKAQNMTMEQYTQQMGMDEQSFNMHFMMNVRESLRQGFSLDALARHLKLTINEDDIQDTLTRMAPENEDKARADIEGSGRIYLLTEAALRTKANKWLVDTGTFIYED